MQITGINIRTTPKKVVTTITYAAPPPNGHPGDRDEHRIKTEDRPHPDLPDALNALRWGFHEVCQMEEDWCDDLHVTALSTTVTEDGRLLYGITAVKTMKYEGEESEMTVTTPFFSPSGTLLDDVTTALSEAKQFVRGKRAQMRLFDADDLMPGGITGMSVRVRNDEGEMEEARSAQKTAGRA